MNLLTKHKKHILQLLESSPHALAYLVFWWLSSNDNSNTDDSMFYEAMGYNGSDNDLPNPSQMCPAWDPPIVLRKAYHPQRIQPLLQFAWEHGFIAEVAACQDGLRRAGLSRFCIGGAASTPATTPSSASSGNSQKRSRT
jgi:hypothetical protein